MLGDDWRDQIRSVARYTFQSGSSTFLCTGQLMNSTLEDESPLMEARRNALHSCLQKLSEKQKKWIQLRYGRHGAVKEEAEREGMSLHKVYYLLEKVRENLLECIGRSLRKEGWSDV